MKNIALSLALLCFGLITARTQSQVNFTISKLPAGQMEQIGIRGNKPPLSWERSVLLEKYEDGYRKTIQFPDSTAELEFKFVYLDEQEQLVWENTQNRSLTIPPAGDLTSDYIWNKEQVVDIDALALLAPEALLEDYELLKTMVLDVHPGTYRYNDRTAVMAALSTLEAKLQQPQTYGEAYLAMSELTASLKCDHTKVGFNNQGRIINSVIHYQADKIPFTFRWIDGDMIVLHNASASDQLQRGTAIRKINDIPVADIRDTMLAYIAADGNTDQNRIYKMQVDGYDFRYNAFDVFYPLLYPPGEASVKLEIQQLGAAEIQTVEVQLLSREDRSEILYGRYPEFPRSRDDLWKLTLINEDVALLEVNSFGLAGWKAMTLDYQKFLAETFATLRDQSIGHLIIDIRQNTGGFDEMKDELFRYLTPDYRPDFKREGRTRYKTFPESLKPYVQTWGDNPWFFNLNPDTEEPVNGYYIFDNNFQQEDNQSDQPVFTGKTYLLTSAANTSLAFYLARHFKDQQLGTIIGQETGGNLNGINGGQILFLRLPNSGIEIDFPIMGGFFLEGQADTGVKPDIETQVSRADLVNGVDVALRTALELIEKE